MAKQDVSSNVSSGTETNTNVDRVLETLNSLVKPAIEVSQEQFNQAHFAPVYAGTGFNYVLEAHEAFRRNTPAGAPDLSAGALDPLEAVETTTMNKIASATFSYNVSTLSGKGINPEASAYVSSILAYAAVKAPDLEESDFSQLQDIARTKVSAHVASTLEGLGIEPNTSEGFQASQDGLKYETNAGIFAKTDYTTLT